MHSRATRQNYILTAPPFKALITLAIPLMVGNLIQTLYSITDAYWVGKIGYVQFSAISYVWPITFIFLAFSIGMTAAATSLIGQSIGASKIKTATDIATQFFVISVIAGILFAIIGSNLSPYIIKLMGAKGELYHYSVAYLSIVFYEMPILFIFHVYKSMCEGQGDTKSPMVILGISVVLNMILDPLFVITLDLGVEGAAYATVLSKIAILGPILVRMFKGSELVHLSVDRLKLTTRVLKNLFSIGIPASIGQTISALGFTIMNSFIVSYGDSTIAAFGLGNRITSLVMMPAFGLGAALATFISQNIGAKQYDRAKQSVFISIAFGFVLLSVGSLFIYHFRLPLIHIFINEPTVVALSSRYMTVLAFVFPLMAILQSILGTFQGSGHTKYVVVITLSRLWILRIPMIILSGHYTTLGSDGIWYAMLVSNLIVCIIGIMIILQGKWLRPTLNL